MSFWNMDLGYPCPILAYVAEVKIYMDMMEEYLFDQEEPLLGEKNSYGTIVPAPTYHKKSPANTLGPAPRTASFQQQPYDNLLAAILTTVFCFFPLGCCSMYYSFKTRRCYKQGQLRRSIMAARHSQTMAQMSCIVGLMLWFGGAITLLLYMEDLL